MIAVKKDACHDVCQSIQPDESIIKTWLNGTFKLLANAVNAFKNRRAIEPLIYASDAQLTDMGLTRDDVYIARRNGLFSDPSIELQKRAHYCGREMKL